jgi:hypothetical protein
MVFGSALFQLACRLPQSCNHGGGHVAAILPVIRRIHDDEP